MKILKKPAAFFLVFLALFSTFTFLQFKFAFVPSVNATTTGVVGTTTDSGGISAPNQHKTFYGAGRFWCFWYNGTGFVYRSSEDNVTWLPSTAPAWVGSCPSTLGSQYSLFYDGTYVHLINASATTSDAMNYSRGTISGSSISWSAPSIIGAASASYSFNVPQIVVNSTGYAMAAYSNGSTFTKKPYACLGTTTGGTWSTVSGFPKELNSTSATGAVSCVVDVLSNGDFYVTYLRASQPIRGRLYTGATATLGAEENPTGTNTSALYLHSTSNIGNDVHMAYTNSTGHIVYVYRTYATSAWSGGETVNVTDTGGATVAPVLSVAYASNVYVMWVNGTSTNGVKILYRVRNSTGWGAETTWQSGSGLTIAAIGRINGFYSYSYNSTLNKAFTGVMWLNGTASPYQLQFDYLSLGDGAESKTASSGTPWGIDAAVNATKPNADANFTSYWTVNNTLSDMHGFIFSYDNTTGSGWTNSTWTPFSTYGSFNVLANYTMTLPSLVNRTMYWTFYANTTTGVWGTQMWKDQLGYYEYFNNVTGTPSERLEVSNSIAQYNSGTNTSLAGSNCQFYVNFTSDTNLDYCYFQWDSPISGSWSTAETVWNDQSTTTLWANVTKTLPSDWGVKIYYRFIANNTLGHVLEVKSNVTTTWDVSRQPSYNVSSYNSTRPSTVCQFSSNWTDSSGLAGYIFSFDDGGGYVNSTFQSIAGSPTTARILYNQTLPNTDRRVCHWSVYMEDALGNWEHSTTQALTVTNSSVVVTTAVTDWAPYATRLPSQQKVFYANGYYWYFAEYENVKFGYKSSSDGVSWSSSWTLLNYAVVSAHVDVYMKGTSVYVAMADGQRTLCYQYGVVGEGTISWTYNKTFTSLPDHQGEVLEDTFIQLDSSNRPWISVAYAWQEGIASAYETYVVESWVYASSTVATAATPWADRSGFPTCIQNKTIVNPSSSTYPFPWAVMCPMSNGDMFFVSDFRGSGDPVFGYEPLFLSWWNETTDTFSDFRQLSDFCPVSPVWDPFTAITVSGTDTLAYAYHSLAATIRYGEVNCTSLVKAAETELWHSCYEYLTIGITPSIDASTPILEYDNYTKSMYVMGISVLEANSIVVMKSKNMTSGTWTETINLADESDLGIPKAGAIVGGNHTYESLLAMQYVTHNSTGNGYNLRYFSVNTTTLLSPPTYTNAGTNDTRTGVYINFTAYWTCSWGLKEAEFFWNYTGSLISNGTYTFSGSPQAGWSNFTRIVYTANTIEWRITCKNVFDALGGMDMLKFTWVTYDGNVPLLQDTVSVKASATDKSGSSSTAFSASGFRNVPLGKGGSILESFVVAVARIFSKAAYPSIAESFGIVGSRSLSKSIGSGITATFSLLGSVRQALSKLGAIAGTFSVGRTSSWAFTRFSTMPLSFVITHLASGLLNPLNFYGAVTTSLAIISKENTLFTHFGLASPSFTIVGLRSNLFQRLGSVAGSFSVLASRAEVVLRSSTVAASFATSGLHGLLSFSRFSTIAESFAVGKSPALGFTHYGAVAESLGALSSRASTFLRSSVEALSLAVSGVHVTGRGFGGSSPISFFTGTSSVPTANWWSTSFAYREKITLNNSAISENLVNFPVPVVFSSTQTSFWAHVNRTTGSDVRFVDADNTTELYFEVEQFNTATNATIMWVKVPQIDSGSTTDYIWIYYGNSTCGFDAYNNKTQVWDSSFCGVWHLDDLLDDDSTGKSANTTIAGSPITAVGQFNNSIDYGTVSNAYATNLGADADIDLSNLNTFTVEFWVYYDSTAVDQVVFHQSQGASSWNVAFGTYDSDVVNNHMKFITRDDDGTGRDTINASMTFNAWVYVAGTYNNGASDLKVLYLNGVNVVSTTSGINNLRGGPATASQVGYGGDFGPMDGRMDEVRVSSSVRSAEWVEACYQYEVDQTKFTVAAEEPSTTQGSSSGGASLLWTFARYATVPASFALQTLTSGLAQFVNLAGSVMMSLVAAFSSGSVFSRFSSLSEVFSVTRVSGITKAVGGAVAESFSVLGARATVLSRSLGLTASFMVSGLDGMVFSRFGIAPLSLAINSLKAVSAATARSIAASFSVASVRLDSLLRFGSASLSTALSGTRSLLESVGGVVAEAFDVGTLRLWTVLKYALTPVAMTVQGVASGFFGRIFTLYSSIPLILASASNRVLSIIRQGNVAEALTFNTVHTLTFLKGGLASLGASVSNVPSFVQSIGGSVLEAFAVSSSRLVTMLGLGSISEAFAVGASRYLAVLRYGLTPLTTTLSSLAEGLLRTLNLYGLIPESFIAEASKAMAMFDLGSVTQILGALGLKAATVLKASELASVFAITKLTSGLPSLLTFFGNILASFNLGSIGSTFMLPYGAGVGDLAMTFFSVAIVMPLILALYVVRRRKRLEPANQL